MEGVERVDADFEARQQVGQAGPSRVVEVERVADGGEFVTNMLGELLDFGRVRHAHGVGEADFPAAHVHVFADHPLHVLIGDAALIRAAEGGDHAAPELEARIQRHPGDFAGDAEHRLPARADVL